MPFSSSLSRRVPPGRLVSLRLENWVSVPQTLLPNSFVFLKLQLISLVSSFVNQGAGLLSASLVCVW